MTIKYTYICREVCESAQLLKEKPTEYLPDHIHKGILRDKSDVINSSRLCRKIDDDASVVPGKSVNLRYIVIKIAAASCT